MFLSYLCLLLFLRFVIVEHCYFLVEFELKVYALVLARRQEKHIVKGGIVPMMYFFPMQDIISENRRSHNNNTLLVEHAPDVPCLNKQKRSVCETTDETLFLCVFCRFTSRRLRRRRNLRLRSRLR